MMIKIFTDLKKSFSTHGLKGRILRSGGSLTTAIIVENALRLFRNMILARLLAPEAFGLMATIMASVQALEALAEVGLRQAVIQNKDGDKPEFLNIVWWISSMRGIFLYSLAYLAAPLICSYFNVESAQDMLRIGFLVILFQGFVSPRLHLLEKELRFTKWVMVVQGSAILSICATIILAFLLKNVWSLILGYVLDTMLRLILSFIFCRFRPRIRWDQAYLSQVIQFARSMFGLPILKMIFYQIDIFVVGKVASIEVLGSYWLIRTLAEVASTFASKIIDPILFPVLASVQSNTSKFLDTFLKVTNVTSMLVFPFTATLIIYSRTILLSVYGSYYAEYSVPFQILCLASLVSLYFSQITQIFFALGRPNLHRIASFTRTLVFAIFIYPLTREFNLTGAAFAVFTATSIALVIQIIYANKVIEISVLKYIDSWIHGIVNSLFVIIPSMYLILYYKEYHVLKLCAAAFLCMLSWLFVILKWQYKGAISETAK